MEAWISMSNDFNIILPDNPCRKVELAESQYSMENSSRALLLSSFGPIISALKGFIVFGRRRYHGLQGLSQRLLIS